jgi:hypothetical protein
LAAIFTEVAVGLPVELAENLPVVVFEEVRFTVVAVVVEVRLLNESSREIVNGVVAAPVLGAVNGLDVMTSLLGLPGLIVSTWEPGARPGALAVSVGDPATWSP